MQRLSLTRVEHMQNNHGLRAHVIESVACDVKVLKFVILFKYVSLAVAISSPFLTNSL